MSAAKTAIDTSMPGSDSLRSVKTVWAGALKPESTKQLAAALPIPLPSFGETCWLTEFEDHADPRSAKDDMYFVPAADSEAIERPTIVDYEYVADETSTDWERAAVLGLGSIALPAVLIWSAFRFLRRR